jgi:hypothetical protein
MERNVNDTNLSNDVELVGVDRKKDSNMTKGIIIGASAVAATWLGICLYKKFKKRAPEQTAPEVDVVK